MNQSAIQIICACGWRGLHSECGDCPSCGHAVCDRINKQRVEALLKLAVKPDSALNPALRISLRRLGLIVPAGPPRGPYPSRRSRPPNRLWSLTDTAHRILAPELCAVLRPLIGEFVDWTLSDGEPEPASTMALRSHLALCASCCHEAGGQIEVAARLQELPLQVTQ
jgi:hypothetical protein